MSCPIKNSGSFHSYVNLPEGNGFDTTGPKKHQKSKPYDMRTMVLVYLPTTLGDFVANDGKYSSTMVRIWASMGMLMEV